MKTIEFKRAQKHLNYFNNLSKICGCFGINYYKYRDILTLDNGKEWLLETFEEIDTYEELVCDAKSKALNHKKTKELKGFESGYSMGEYTGVKLISEFRGEEFINGTVILDNRKEYLGQKKYPVTHGYKVAVFRMNEKGSIRFVKFEEKVK